MPAKLVERVPGGVAVHWIEHELTRVGGAGMEVALAKRRAGEHLVTIEHDGGRYTVYNKGKAAGNLGSVELASNGQAAWETGTALRIGGAEVTLELSGDGRPAPRPLQDEAPAPAAARRNLAGGRTASFLVAAAGLAAALGLVVSFRMLTGGAEPAAAGAEGESRLQAMEAFEAAWGRDPRFPALRGTLQQAFAAENRRRWGDAYAAYRQTRDLLAERRRDGDAAAEDPLLGYVGRKMLKMAALAGR